MKKLWLASAWIALGGWLAPGWASADIQAPAPQLGRIVVEIDGFRDSQGVALVALYRNQDDWLKLDKAFKVLRAPITGNKISVTFEPVPYGVYAVSVIHDHNNNGKLDMHYLPIPGPSEGAGTSRDAKASFGPPSYTDAYFDFQRPAALIPIKLRY